MSVNCGSACINCELPIRLDTYTGCSHACRYCFNRRFRDISEIKPSNCTLQLKKFIAGDRNKETKWCDWNIPLHWGGNSDPFQPCEEQYGVSYECLKIFAETQYPFVISTKGRLIATEKYLELLKECDAVVQISMTSPQLDKLEPGAPSFEERMQMIKKIQPNCRRVVIRVQPYILETKNDVLEEIPRWAEAGVHGIVVEGMRFKKKAPWLVKVGNEWEYPAEYLERDFIEIRDKAHSEGLKFYSGTPDLRAMGDDLCCCGVGDLYKTNKITWERYMQGQDLEFSPAQLQKGTARCFRSINQATVWSRMCDTESYATMFYKAMKEKE